MPTSRQIALYGSRPVAAGPVTIVSDSFNRADNASSLGNADTGQAWVALTGIWGISSNQAYLITTSNDRAAVINAAVSDCTVLVTVPVVGGAGNNPGLTLRATDDNNLLELECIAGSITLYKKVATAYTSLGSSATTLLAGDVLKAVLLGTSIKIYVNSTLVISVTDATFQTNTKHGIGANSNSARFDNFLVTVP